MQSFVATDQPGPECLVPCGPRLCSSLLPSSNFHKGLEHLFIKVNTIFKGNWEGELTWSKAISEMRIISNDESTRLKPSRWDQEGSPKSHTLGLSWVPRGQGRLCMATGVVCNPSIMIEHRFEIQDMRVRPHQGEQAWSLCPYSLGSHGK